MLVLLIQLQAMAYVPILITLFIPATCMVRRCALVLRTATIGRPLRTVATARTTCTSTVATSTQARTTTTSTTVVWRVASLESRFQNPSQVIQFPPSFFNFSMLKLLKRGKVAEWFKAHAWKACKGATLSQVQILSFPP